MGRIIWVTNISKQVFAVVNPLWAWYYEGYPLPSRLILIWNEGVKNELNEVINFVKRIYDSAGARLEFETVEIPEDFEAYWNYFGEKVIERILEMEEVDEVILDMTPGRKFMSVVMFRAFGILKEKFKKIGREVVVRIIYLHLLDLTYQSEPFPKIPFSKQKMLIYPERGV